MWKQGSKLEYCKQYLQKGAKGLYIVAAIQYENSSNISQQERFLLLYRLKIVSCNAWREVPRKTSPLGSASLSYET